MCINFQKFLEEKISQQIWFLNVTKNQTVLYRDSCFKFDITRSANGIYNEEQGLKVSHWKENKTLNRKCIHDLFCPQRNLTFFLKNHHPSTSRNLLAFDLLATGTIDNGSKWQLDYQPTISYNMRYFSSMMRAAWKNFFTSSTTFRDFKVIRATHVLQCWTQFRV